MTNESSTIQEMPLSPNFEKGIPIPPEVKHFDGGIFVGYFYPHLQIAIQNKIQMPHGNKSLKHIITEYDKVHQEQNQSLMSKLVEGEERRDDNGKIIDRTGGIKQDISHGLDVAGITHQELSQRSISNDKRLAYVEHMKGNKMHGLRNIHFEKDESGDLTVVMDSMGIAYPSYIYLRSPQLPEDMLDLANPTGTAVVLQTSDNKFILQYRRPYDPDKHIGNRMHGGIPGASAAGMWKQIIDSPQANAKQEAREELGLHINPEKSTDSFIERAKELSERELHLEVNDLSDMFVTGLSGDLSVVHAEILLLGKLNIDATTLEQRSLHTKYVNDPQYDFEERYVTIPATSESIWKLLTQFKCPLPANHIAAFTAAGLTKKQDEIAKEFPDISQQERQKKLDEWYSALEISIRKNYEDIDRLAGGTYDFSRTPSTQDTPTPSFAQELKKVFGIPFSIEDETTGETLKQPTNAYLFDIDGVLTDPDKKEIVRPQILQEIVARLKRNEPIGFNTGRSLQFIEEKVLRRLEDMLYESHLPKSILSNLIAIGEKGGTWITYKDKGEKQTHIDPDLTVPTDLQANIQDLTKDAWRTMFYDTTKQTMITVEMKKIPENLKPEEKEEFKRQFKADQQQLVAYLQDNLRRLGLENTLSIDPTRIATDVQNKKAGKALGAQIFVNILKEKGINPKRYISFGDSTSDYEMHQELQDQGLNSHFIYVGSREDLKNRTIENVTFTQDNNYPVDEGTEFFLI